MPAYRYADHQEENPYMQTADCQDRDPYSDPKEDDSTGLDSFFNSFITHIVIYIRTKHLVVYEPRVQAL